MAQTTEELTSSNRGPPPMGHSSEVLNQSDKLLIKTVRSFYLNKYGFKTP